MSNKVRDTRNQSTTCPPTKRFMISVLSLSAFKIHDQDVAGEKIARHDVKNETMTSLLSFEDPPNL